MAKCPNCGSNIEEGIPYCPYCGIRIIWKSDPDMEDLEDLILMGL